MKPLSGMTRLVRSVFFATSAMIFAYAVSAAAQAGVPVPQDSPVYQSFSLLKNLQAYRMNINMQSHDPRRAKDAATGAGFGTIEKLVEGDTTQVIMHMKMPAMDAPGTMDDWEIRAVAQDGRVARMFSSPAVARINKLNEQMRATQMTMLDKQAGTAVTHALTQGPLGAISAGMAAGQTALMHAEAPRKLHETESSYSWKCLETSTGSASKKAPAQLTDLKTVGNEAVGATAATIYEFYANDGNGPRGPVRLYVATDGKDIGLPLRIHMDDPQGYGSMDIDYSYGPFRDFEVPECLTQAQ
jgi:hypothetical protein